MLKVHKCIRDSGEEVEVVHLEIVGSREEVNLKLLYLRQGSCPAKWEVAWKELSGSGEARRKW